MRYAQVRLTERQFIIIKKAALDAKMTLEHFIKASVFERLLKDSLTRKEGKDKEDKEESL
jgi:hypothetical protein